jgi:hypothetical protein
VATRELPPNPSPRGASVAMIFNDDAFWVIASAPTEDALDWLDEAGRDLG